MRDTLKKHKNWLIPLASYLLALLIYLLICGASLALDTTRQRSGEMGKKTLLFTDFYAEGVIVKENATGGLDLISTDDDPRMIYSPGERFHAGRFTFSAETQNRPGGEMTLYYTTKPGEDFSAQKRLTARQNVDGNWYFDLGGRKLTALRFDPGTKGGVLWRNWAITLNEEKPLSSYLVPTAQTAFALLFFPALAAAVLLEGLQLRAGWLRAAKGAPPPTKTG